ncbi:ubiquitin c-terminal hydrolase [Grosmannia clavigera kw1407]|uniref:ubiquitinyl hydrolase 1 n=1 Tax=Grosmannia clavigera (strain kw1407 / UAMH 11150) TaxID=655863 RepID=F0XRY8_GROCL|nr:ubiquitin c-terminal hydrolase [Grosmannia clavigera kw1407]EFW99650.1 ubiquitin c-terminal hydrolase [Grosmannia clavigera kw1407]
MSSFFNKLKPGVAAANNANNVSPSKRKDEVVPEATPLEKMLHNAGAIRDDGTDKFFGLENLLQFHSSSSLLLRSLPRERHPIPTIFAIQYPKRTTAKGECTDPATVERHSRRNGARVCSGSSRRRRYHQKNTLPPQPFKPRPLVGPGQPPSGQQAMRPEDKPDSPEYKKKQAMIKGPVLELAQENAGAYGMDECTFTGLKDIFMAFIESNSRTGVLSPLRFLELFRQANESFKTAMHQDAHEFYGLVLNDVIKNIEAASRQFREREDLRSQSDLKASVEAVLGSVDGIPPSALSPYDGTTTPGSGWVHDIFEGVLTSETRCLTCETSSQRDETFLDLSIDLEEHSSVTSCLRKFSAEEMLCERDKFHCDTCGGLQEAEKRMKIKRLPKILALHLKRFKYAENYTKLEKLFHRVVYPYQLRMFNTTDDAQDPDRLYELYAVVIHIGGNAYHGHYVAVIKTKERGWLLFDDEMVEPVDKHYVRNFFGDKPGTACAYVLFYQETTFEKVQAEQEAEGLEEIKLASQSAGLALSPEGSHAHLNGNGENLVRQATQPALHTVDDHDELLNLEHARTAPGAVFGAAPAIPPVPHLPTSPTSAVAHAVATEKALGAKLEAARCKEEKEKQKKEAKAAEKARKMQEKEHSKGMERSRKEREAQRKAEQEEMRRVLAASKHTAAEEKEARKNSLDAAAAAAAAAPISSSAPTSAGSPRGSSFLGRNGRGSKSMSRRSFAFLGKDREKFEPSFGVEHGVNGSANGFATGSTQKPAPASLLPQAPPSHGERQLKDRFSFSLGRKKSNTFLP